MRLQIADCRVQIGLAIVGLTIVASPARTETIDRVLAVVAGQLITLTDVTAARDLGLQPADNAADPVRAILSKLIDRELILAEVDRYAPPEPAADAIEREVERTRARFSSADGLASTLARSGIDEKHLREIIRQDRRIHAYLEPRFASAPERRQALMDDWMTGLRRRGDVVDLYHSAK